MYGLSFVCGKKYRFVYSNNDFTIKRMIFILITQTKCVLQRGVCVDTVVAQQT